VTSKLNNPPTFVPPTAFTLNNINHHKVISMILKHGKQTPWTHQSSNPWILSSFTERNHGEVTGGQLTLTPLQVIMLLMESCRKGSEGGWLGSCSDTKNVVRLETRRKLEAETYHIISQLYEKFGETNSS
jgi:hypothetical protein